MSSWRPSDLVIPVTILEEKASSSSSWRQSDVPRTPTPTTAISDLAVNVAFEAEEKAQVDTMGDRMRKWRRQWR